MFKFLKRGECLLLAICTFLFLTVHSCRTLSPIQSHSLASVPSSLESGVCRGKSILVVTSASSILTLNPFRVVERQYNYFYVFPEGFYQYEIGELKTTLAGLLQ